MAEITIRLRIDPQTGKKNVIIVYESEEDALPIEHEQDHKAIVDKLIAGGALAAGELGNIIVERLPDKDAVAQPAQEEPAERAAVAKGE